MIEEWKKIKGYENYEISNLGRFKNSKGISYGYTDAYGYRFTTLYPGKKPKKIHTLIYEAFNNCEIIWPMTINHINESKDDNRLENLEILSTQDNTRYSRSGKKMSKEFCDNLSKKLKGRIFSKDHCKNMSESKKGTKATDKAKENMSKSQLGRKHSEETKLKIGSSNKGKKRSTETKIKMSNSKKNYVPWNKGIKCSDETKSKISETLKNKNKS